MLIDASKLRHSVKYREIKHLLDCDLEGYDEERVNILSTHKENLTLNNEIDMSKYSIEYLYQVDSPPTAKGMLNAYSLSKVCPLLVDANYNILCGEEYLYKAILEDRQSALPILILNTEVVSNPYYVNSMSYEELRDTPDAIYRLVGVDREMLDVSYDLCARGLVTKFTCIGHDYDQLSPHIQICISPRVPDNLLIAFETAIRNSNIAYLLDIEHKMLIEDGAISVPNLNIESVRGLTLSERLQLVDNIRILLQNMELPQPEYISFNSTEEWVAYKLALYAMELRGDVLCGSDSLMYDFCNPEIVTRVLSMVGATSLAFYCNVTSAEVMYTTSSELPQIGDTVTYSDDKTFVVTEDPNVRPLVKAVGSMECYIYRTLFEGELVDTVDIIQCEAVVTEVIY